MTDTPIAKNYALHGVRALAAMLVVVAHLVMRLLKYDVIGPEWSWLTKAGSAGVYSFFAISGYIMLKTSMKSFGGPGAVGKFFKRRAIRIIPLYYVFVLLFLLKLFATGEAWTWAELLLSLSFLPYVNADGLMQPIYSLGWTLNYEIYFYAVFGFSLLFSRQIGVALTFIVISVVVMTGLGIGERTPIGDPQNHIAFYGDTIVLFFLAGMIIAIAPRVMQLPSTGCFLLAFGLILFGLASRDPTLLAITCVAAVYAASMEAPNTWRSPTERLMEVLGESSYSIYLTHSFVLGPIVAVGLKFGLLSGPSAWPYIVFCLASCAAAGVVSFMIIERPILLYLRGPNRQRADNGSAGKPAAGPTVEVPGR
jgi:peptidoglycan/LPS O-acetylase OafA/YrhL